MVLFIVAIVAGIVGVLSLAPAMVAYKPGRGSRFLILGLVLGGFCACGALRTVKLQTLDIDGLWAEYLEVETGKYKFEISGTRKAAVLSIPIGLRLKKPWRGESSNPAATLSLQPLTKEGAALLGEFFLVADTDRFNSFVRREPGARMTISFRRAPDLPVLSKGQARKIASSIRSFEGWSGERTVVETFAEDAGTADTEKRPIMEIDGLWAEYLEAETGKHKFEIAGTGKAAILSVPINFTLKKTWDGENPNPAITLSLQPLTKEGAALPGESFLVVDTDRFNSFIQREPGDRMTISFRRDAALPVLSKSQAKKLASSIRSFEGWSAERAAGKFVVAVAPVNMEGEAQTSPAVMRMALISGLRENAVASGLTFVDTSQIDLIMEQHEFEVTDWSRGEKAAEIGKALNASILVITQVSVKGARPEYAISILDINSMEVLGVATGSVKSLNDLSGVARDMKINLPAR
jgi:hypothetical protein